MINFLYIYICGSRETSFFWLNKFSSSHGKKWICQIMWELMSDSFIFSKSDISKQLLAFKRCRQKKTSKKNLENCIIIDQLLPQSINPFSCHYGSHFRTYGFLFFFSFYLKFSQIMKQQEGLVSSTTGWLTGHSCQCHLSRRPFPCSVVTYNRFNIKTLSSLNWTTRPHFVFLWLYSCGCRQTVVISISCLPAFSRVQ